MIRKLTVAMAILASVSALICIAALLNAYRLHTAIVRGNTPTVLKLLDSDFLLITMTDPLHLAIEHEQLDVFRALLQTHYSPNAIDADGITVTDKAAMNRNPIWLELCLDSGADPNLLNSASGYSRGRPLFFAIGKNNRDNVRVLIEGGGDPDLGIDFAGSNSLVVASNLAYWEVVTDLLNNGASPTLNVNGTSFIDTLKNRDFSQKPKEIEVVLNTLKTRGVRNIDLTSSFFGQVEDKVAGEEKVAGTE